VLRTVIDRAFDFSLVEAFKAAYAGYANVTLDLAQDELLSKLAEFFEDRLRGLLEATLPADAVLACLAVASDRPVDARARAVAIAMLDKQQRAGAGEVFKRATNIAGQAPSGEPVPPDPGAHPSERALFDTFLSRRAALRKLVQQRDYRGAFAAVSELVPVLHTYFEDILVMAEDAEIRSNRLRLMRAISDMCRELARLELLGG
jgi:glycyl-tRNA synthetase beta chain